MGFKLVNKPTTIKATTTLAKKWVEMTPAPHDRQLSERRLQVYERLLNEGKFRPVTWASAHCQETDETYRVNGKHTSTLLSGLDKIPGEFFVTIESYECDTLEDVAKLYATFDSGMQSRTSRDIYLSFASTVKELEGVTEKAISAAVSGMAFHNFGQESYCQRTQPADRAELLLDHPEFVLWLSGLLSGSKTRGEMGDGRACKLKAGHLYRQPVVAAMFACWQKAKAPATEFWRAVRDETGTSPSVPDRKIARWLITSSLTSKEHTRIRKAGARETYAKCLHAWNAWRKNEGTNLNYHADAKVPVAQ